jgi:L-cysteine desulfidase
VSGNYEAEVAIASAWSGGGGSVHYGIAWQDFVAPTMHGIHAAVYAGHANGALPSTRTTGCGNLGITITGLPAIGRTISFDQTDSGPLTGFVFGFPAAVPIGVCPGCVLGVDGAVVTNPFAVVLPPSPGFVGMQFACQAWSFLSGTCLGSIALSDTIDFTVL